MAMWCSLTVAGIDKDDNVASVGKVDLKQTFLETCTTAVSTGTVWSGLSGGDPVIIPWNKDKSM